MPELVAGGAALLALVLLALLWVWFPARAKPTLSIDIEPNPAQVGTTATVFAVVQLRSFRPAMLRASLSDGRSIRLWSRPGKSQVQSGSFPIPLSERGNLTVGPFRIIRVDPIGFANRQLLQVKARTLVVWPAVFDAEPVNSTGRSSVSRFAGASAANRPRLGEAEPASLRPYVAGDELRLMHWTASARGRGLMVRTFDELRPQHPVVVLDDRMTSHTAKSFEFAVSVAASLVCAGGPIPHAGRPDSETKMGLWSELALDSPDPDLPDPDLPDPDSPHPDSPHPGVRFYHGVKALNRLANLAAFVDSQSLSGPHSVHSFANLLDGVDVLITGPYSDREAAFGIGTDLQVLAVDAREADIQPLDPQTSEDHMADDSVGGFLTHPAQLTNWSQWAR